MYLMRRLHRYITGSTSSPPIGWDRCRYLCSSADGVGTVHFIATPIGNLGDITIRAIETLRKVDVICAEDTRRSIQLLRHFDIPQKLLISYHEHSHVKQINNIVKMALEGMHIGVVSDAGTPAISDPGSELAAACVESGIPVCSVPGPSAVTTAVSISGFSGTAFTFLGFLPHKGVERKRTVNLVQSTLHIVVLYEAPHRMMRTMTDLSVVHGDRRCVCCRELTKLHEEVWRGSISESLLWLREKMETSEPGESGSSVRGEFTIVLAPYSPGVDREEKAQNAQDMLRSMMRDGVKRSEAVQLVADSKLTNLRKSEIYKLALDMDWS